MHSNDSAEWFDTDGDGIGNNEDDFFDPSQVTDSDGDGFGVLGNGADKFPNDSTHQILRMDMETIQWDNSDAFFRSNTMADSDGDGYGDNRGRLQIFSQ